MKLATRLTIGTVVAGAMIGLAAPASVATPAVSDDVHPAATRNGPYPTWDICEIFRAAVEVYARTGPCFVHGGVWYFFWE